MDFRKQAQEQICATPYMSMALEKIRYADPKGAKITHDDIIANTPKHLFWRVRNFAPGCGPATIARGLAAELSRAGFKAEYSQAVTGVSYDHGAPTNHYAIEYSVNVAP